MITGHNTAFDDPVQRLPKETYYETDWFEREKRELFDHSWIYACTEDVVSDCGDYYTLRYMEHSLVVIRDMAGEAPLLSQHLPPPRL